MFSALNHCFPLVHLYPWVYHRDAKPTLEQGAGFLFQKLVMLDKFLKLILSALQSIKFNKHTSLQGQVQFWMTVPFILLVKVFYGVIMMKSCISCLPHISVCPAHELFLSSSFLRKVWIEDCELAESWHDQDHVEERLGCSRNTLALRTSP